MTSGSTRIAGILAILIGFMLTLTGFGALIGIPLITIGFILVIPELFILFIILGIVLLIIVLLAI